MTISSNVASLFDGSLLSRVQDALGNSGASATLTDGSIKVTGTPTGEGLKSRAAALSSKATTVPTNKDIVSLSPTARTALTNQEIGLKLIVAGKASSSSAATGSRASAPPTSSVSSTSSSSTIDASDVVSLARQDPTQVITDVVAAGQNAVASISTTEGFTAAASADPAFLAKFAGQLPDNLGAGFIAALKNGTLEVQTPEQLGFTAGSVSLTGTSERAIGSSGTANYDLSTTNGIVVGFGFGTLAFKWPKADSDP